MAKQAPLKAVLSGVRLSFGLVTTTVDLVSVQQSKATRAKSSVSTVNLCPTCETDERLASQLHCPKGHGPFTSDDARKGVVLSESIASVTEEEIAEARAPEVAERTAELAVFPAEQVEAATFPSGNLFRLRAEPTKTYGLLQALVADPMHAFVCEMVLKGKTGLYRAVAHQGTIVLMELIRPERMLPITPVDAPVDDRLVAQGDALVTAMLQDFVPDDWADVRAARVRELEGRPEDTAVEVTDAETAANDLRAMLEAVEAA